MNTTNAKKKGKSEAEIKEREYCEVRSHEVKDVRVIETRKGDMVLFTLVINGITIYSCRVATGKNGDFISFPQYKGTNGNYYNTVYVVLSDEDSKKILDEIQAEIDKG